ncbi:MAG: Xaa-Pro dipeptidase [Firmicutes bacterium HGW-Firmicutes-7]|nr:MAG: Xaa-Pro dipeptidase [Firmicutes bacterium HGW-Firmicutes-7]
MNTRIKQLQTKLKQLNIDSILIYDEMNRRYLSGFTGSSGYLYISTSRSVLLTDFRYMEQAAKQCKEFEVFDHSDLGILKTFQKIISEDHAEKIGFETGISYSEYKALNEELASIQLIETTNIVEDIRMIKDEDELSCIKKAAFIADGAFKHILPFIKIGVTEIDIALELEYYMKKNGGQKLSFDTIVASGKNSSLCHAEPSLKKIEKGDFITMDFGCVYNGYCSDMTRTVVMGSASDTQKKIYNIVLNAQKMALNSLMAGLTGQEVDRVARDIIYEAGYRDNFGHGLGHSLGLEVHENPRVAPKGHVKLQQNMMVTIEPGIYIPGYGGVRIEDLVCVKENGYENFTHSEKDLIEL